MTRVAGKHHAQRRAEAYAGSPPAGISPARWYRMVADAAAGIAEADGRPDNDVTPEFYAAAALRAVAGEIRRSGRRPDAE